MRLKAYLDKKPLFYKKIDYARMPRAYSAIKDHIMLKEVIHIVGTNGKGSTGRFLTQILRANGKSVGHYTSPHVLKFNERFYLNDRIASDDELEDAHDFLQKILSYNFKEKLSYFEYTTLLAAVLFKNCDFVVLESGMGAQFDATNVFDKKLSIFTPIGLDHIPTLGKNIEEISRTKLVSMDKFAILNDEMNETSVKIAHEIAIKKDCKLKFASELLWQKTKSDIKKYIQKYSMPSFQSSNLALACAAAVYMGYEVDILNLDRLQISGRMEKIAPNITIDVGHNELAAKEVAREFAGKKVVLVYNSFIDKDIEAVLKLLKPIINRVEIINYESPNRELGDTKIREILTRWNIKCTNFKEINECEEYLVFGSFLVVESFLKGYFDKEN